MATKGHFHIITVNLYIFNFTSELLSAESSSSLLVFPVRGEQRKHQLFIPYTAVKMALSSLISNEFSRLWGGKKKKKAGVSSTVWRLLCSIVHYANKVHSGLTVRLTETSSGQTVQMVLKL